MKLLVGGQGQRQRRGKNISNAWKTLAHAYYDTLIVYANVCDTGRRKSVLRKKLHLNILETPRLPPRAMLFLPAPAELVPDQSSVVCCVSSPKLSHSR